MGLRDITIAKKTVSVGDQAFDVRGLSYADITGVVNTYGKETSELFETVLEQAREGGLDQGTVRGAAKRALIEFPKLVSDLAALAADEPDMGPKFAQLPIPVQADALDKIISLTITSEGELEKLIQIVTRGLAAVTTAVVALKGSPSLDGSGG